MQTWPLLAQSNALLRPSLLTMPLCPHHQWTSAGSNKYVLRMRCLACGAPLAELWVRRLTSAACHYLWQRLPRPDATIHTEHGSRVPNPPEPSASTVLTPLMPSSGGVPQGEIDGIPLVLLIIILLFWLSGQRAARRSGISSTRLQQRLMLQR